MHYLHWYRNRELQIRFEQALTDAQWKAQNVSEDGSGGRTYAVLLYMFGLWYEDSEDGVKITLAGKEILEGNPAVPIMTKQLLDYQYPSSYSIKRNVDVSTEYRIWPFRFLLNLLLDESIDQLTQDEIAFCIIPFAKNMDDIADCVQRIENYRDAPDPIKLEALRISNTSADNLINIANTAINQFEYTGFFEEEYDRRSLALREERIDEIQRILDSMRTTLIQDPEDDVKFQSRYGTGLDISKDYSRSIRQPMVIDPNKRKIITEYMVVASTQPIYEVTDDLIAEISARVGAPISLVRNALNELPVQSQTNQFYEAYLQLSTGGKRAAEDFEVKTTTLYKRGFGFAADWVGRTSRYPDILVYLDWENFRHGIIDTKAYQEYNLPLDHKLLMAHTYIPALMEIEVDGQKFDLAFFGYVSGGFSSTISRSFAELITMTDIPGHYITAQNLLGLLEKNLQEDITVEQFFEFFCINGEITPDVFNVN